MLTSGGDAPGMNATVRAVARTAFVRRWEVIGVEAEYRGLLEGRMHPLDSRMVGGILHRGRNGAWHGSFEGVHDPRRAGARSRGAIASRGRRACGHWREREPDRGLETGGTGGEGGGDPGHHRQRCSVHGHGHRGGHGPEYFLQAVANVLAMVMERKEAQEKLDEVREAERSRIARDLHDDALQDLSGALVDAQRLKALSTDSEASRLSERLLATLDRVEPHLKGAIYNLSLEGEHDRPFDVLLEGLVELQRTMAPHLQIALDVQEGVLDGALGETGREILRILGEALTNARRHSGAESVRVFVTASEGRLHAEVAIYMAT